MQTMLELKEQQDKNLAMHTHTHKEDTALAKLLGTILGIIVGPLLTIWALNTLFPVLAIAYTFWNWCATLLLAGLLKSKVTVNRD